MSDRQYWFKRKRFGIGWSPRTWEGWAATGAFVLLQSVAPTILKRLSGLESARFVGTARFGLAAGFVAFVAITGEPLW